ncbi:MAG: hydroxysqualene dehydroxylase HpnE [Verrucomicrobiota bacterium]
MSQPENSEQITKKSGSNLALSFVSLSVEKQQAMNSFYAYCRLIDDIADSTELSIEEKDKQLKEWRSELELAYTGTPKTELGRELQKIIKDYLIPPKPILEVLDGVESDLHQIRHPDYNSLYQYCYRVASAVGLVSIEIFGYRHRSAHEYAIALGMAFQITNIIRDVRKDASFGRIYLPQDEMRDFGAKEEDILQNRFTPELQKLLHFQYHRATSYFERAEKLLHPEDRSNMVAAQIMAKVYRGILEKAKRLQFNVIDHQAGLNKIQKAYAVWTSRKPQTKKHHTPAQKILIIGAGFAGLSAATELALKGHQVTVVEKLQYPGGRASSFEEAQTGDEIDNGQHALMGCYHSTLDLFKKWEVESLLEKPSRLRVPYRDKNKASLLQAAKLPAPLDMLSALLGFQALTWKGKISAIRLCLGLKLNCRPTESQTALEWLESSSQTPDSIQSVWEPLCLAALNEPLASASASLLATVIQKALLSGPHDAKIYLAKCGLSQLLHPQAPKMIEYCGGKVIYGTTVKSLTFKSDTCTTVEFSHGREESYDQVISTLPWFALKPLIPMESNLFQVCEKIKSSPLMNLHLWFDQPLTKEPFIGFLHSPLHWLFNSSQFKQHPSKKGFHHSIVISGSYEWDEKTTAEIVQMTLNELSILLPESKDLKPIHHFLYRSKTATFASTPSNNAIRPTSATDWKNFWIAGDWTQTELPGTIEGAVVSGKRAATLLEQSITTL